MKPSPSQRAWTRHHREMLVIACLVVILAFVLQVRGEEKVAVAGRDSLTLPPLCFSYATFGVRCPGCGLTRSFVHLAHGNWAASWHQHRVGWFLALLVVLQIPYRILSLRHPDRPLLGNHFPRYVGYLLLVLLLANWLADLFIRGVGPPW
jgi:Protein of unknown function (DUF2752)